MTAIVDYGVGNLFSLKSSFAAIGEEAEVSSDPQTILSADRIVLPGVGAFRDAAGKLRESGLDRTVVQAAEEGMPLLGICLGMQLLFERSFEYGEYQGLGLIRGEIRPLRETVSSGMKIPQMGWNALHLTKPECPLFRYIREGDYVYFVHSYHGVGCGESLCAVTDYSAPVTAAVRAGNVFGCQFHPEKSGRTGLSILRAFSEVEAC